MWKYLQDIYNDPLKVTITRRDKIDKDYGSLESFLRSLLLPVESKNAIIDLLKEMVLIILPIITFGVVFMTVISGSMYPTIHTGDSMLASNIYYGGKFSAFTYNKWWYSTASLIKFATPRKGHIVVFKDDIDKDKTWVKRIIGEPGETIQFKNGILYINDIPVKLKFKTNHYWLKEKGEYSGPYTEFEETLPNGVSYSIIWQNKGIHRNTPKYYIPEGYYFMVGDNRDNSADSRSTLGFVPAANISGRVMFIMVHHQYGLFGTLFGNPILWLKGFDLSRIFKQLH